METSTIAVIVVTAIILARQEARVFRIEKAASKRMTQVEALSERRMRRIEAGFAADTVLAKKGEKARAIFEAAAIRLDRIMAAAEARFVKDLASVEPDTCRKRGECDGSTG